jgi:capsular exopolysaccharide synthesis family protein
MTMYRDDGLLRETLQHDQEDELRESLIVYCRLTAEAIERIDQSVRASGMSFVEAATHNGLVTASEAAEAQAWVVSNRTRRNTGVIETAVRRQSSSRYLTIRHNGVGRPTSRLALARNGEDPYSARIRVLRDELLLLNQTDRQAGSLAILSPCSREGRSQLAAELAIAFSQAGRSTLLVDADLRRPALHSLFGIESSWGLAQALAHDQPAQLFAVEDLPFLSVLPCGPAATNPSEMLSGNRFVHLVNRWRSTYDFVIMDTPPALDHADAVSIAAASRSVVLLSHAQITQHKQMKELLRRLRLTQARILGAVLGDF